MRICGALGKLGKKEIVKDPGCTAFHNLAQSLGPWAKVTPLLHVIISHGPCLPGDGAGSRQAWPKVGSFATSQLVSFQTRAWPGKGELWSWGKLEEKRLLRPEKEMIDEISSPPASLPPPSSLPFGKCQASARYQAVHKELQATKDAEIGREPSPGKRTPTGYSMPSGQSWKHAYKPHTIYVVTFLSYVCICVCSQGYVCVQIYKDTLCVCMREP